MVTDVKTIDEMSGFFFRDDAARACWDTLIQKEYFSNPIARRIMDYARRWAKLMQLHLVEGIDFNNVVVVSANEANIQNISNRQKQLAKDILIAIWKYGPELEQWSRTNTL